MRYIHRGRRLSVWSSLVSLVVASAYFSELTSAMTDHHLLLAWLLPAKRKQETCQKCRRHGDSVHRPVRTFSFVVRCRVECRLRSFRSRQGRWQLHLSGMSPFRATVASARLGKPDIISGRGSGIFLLCQMIVASLV